MSGVLRRYESDSKPGRFYEIQRAGDGSLYCSCPKWRFQKGVDPKERTCKHLVMFEMEQGLCQSLAPGVEQPLEVEKFVVAKARVPRAEPKPKPKKIRRGGTFWG